MRGGVVCEPLARVGDCEVQSGVAGRQEEGDFVDGVFRVFFVGRKTDLTVGGEVEGDVEGVWCLG